MLLAPTGFFKLVTIVYVDIPRYFLRVSNSPINWSLYNYAAKQEERKKEKDLAWLSTIHKAFVRFIYLFFFRGRGKACGLVPFLVAWLDDVAALTGGHLTSQLRFFNHNRKRERERALPFFRDANVSHTRYLCASRPAGNLYKNILRDTEGKDVTHLESIRSCSYLLRCFFQSIPTLAADDEEYFYSNGLIFLLDRRNVPQETTECGQIVIPWREAAPHRLGCAISSTYFFSYFPPPSSSCVMTNELFLPLSFQLCGN